MSKKVMILIVVIECVLSILLIAVLGKAAESIFYEVAAQDIYFTTFTDDVTPIFKDGELDTLLLTDDGKIVLKPGMLYKEKEKTVEMLPNDEYNYEGVTDDIIIEYINPENVSLKYIIYPLNTANKAVTFSCKDQDIEIEESGRVHFLGAEIRPIQVTVMTQNAQTATVILKQRRSDKPISI